MGSLATENVVIVIMHAGRRHQLCPCAVSTSARGADVTAAGVNVNPSLIEVFAEGVAIWPWAINIQPALIYINPWGTDIA